MFIGTITNVITVLLGSTIGSLAGSRLPERVRHTVTAALGLLTLAIGVRESLASADFVLVLAAILLGALAGELLRLEQGLARLGDQLQRRFSRAGSSRFSERFVISSLVFCVGPLTVLGSIQDGLGQPGLLFVKGGLDGFASIAFASVYGWGVAGAALTVGVVQGAIASLASLLSEALTEPMLDGIASAGGVLLLGVGLRLLDLSPVRVANLLPALVFAPLLVAWFG